GVGTVECAAHHRGLAFAEAAVHHLDALDGLGRARLVGGPAGGQRAQRAGHVAARVLDDRAAHGRVEIERRQRLLVHHALGYALVAKERRQFGRAGPGYAPGELFFRGTQRLEHGIVVDVALLALDVESAGA